MLARTFHESDLLVTEVVRSGLLDDLGAADLAALVSMLVVRAPQLRCATRTLVLLRRGPQPLAPVDGRQ